MELDEAIEWIRAYAEGARTMNRHIIAWHADRVRIQLGQVQVLDVDGHDPDARMVHCMHGCAPYGHFHYVKDLD